MQSAQKRQQTSVYSLRYKNWVNSSTKIKP